jgi:hypothetical protein
LLYKFQIRYAPIGNIKSVYLTRRISGKVNLEKESIDAKMESILVAAVLSVCATTLVNRKSKQLMRKV